MLSIPPPVKVDKVQKREVLGMNKTGLAMAAFLLRGLGAANAVEMGNHPQPLNLRRAPNH